MAWSYGAAAALKVVWPFFAPRCPSKSRLNSSKHQPGGSARLLDRSQDCDARAHKANTQRCARMFACGLAHWQLTLFLLVLSRTYLTSPRGSSQVTTTTSSGRKNEKRIFPVVKEPHPQSQRGCECARKGVKTASVEHACRGKEETDFRQQRIRRRLLFPWHARTRVSPIKLQQ